MWRGACLAVDEFIYSGRLRVFNNYSQQPGSHDHPATAVELSKTRWNNFICFVKGNVRMLSNQPLGYYWLVYLVIWGTGMPRQAFVPAL